MTGLWLRATEAPRHGDCLSILLRGSAAPWVVIFALTGCSVDDRSPRPALKPVTLPDVSGASAPVQQQIRDRYATLQVTIGRADVAEGEMAVAFGDMGSLFTAAEYYDAAEVCFENARTLAPRDRRWPYFLGHVYRLENDPAKAISAFEQALALSPDEVPVLIWLADMHLAENRPEAAEPLLTRAQSLEQESGAVRFGLGRVALGYERFRRGGHPPRTGAATGAAGQPRPLPAGAGLPRPGPPRRGRGAPAPAWRGGPAAGRPAARRAVRPAAERLGPRGPGVAGDGGTPMGRRGGEPAPGDRCWRRGMPSAG